MRNAAAVIIHNDLEVLLCLIADAFQLNHAAGILGCVGQQVAHYLGDCFKINLGFKIFHPGHHDFHP